jgi:uncharacterized protein with von Willebrand factor type A (vWA) domain
MLEQIDFTESIRNAQINHGIESFNMQEDDLAIRETDFKSQTSTVLMIDISTLDDTVWRRQDHPGKKSRHGIE